MRRRARSALVGQHGSASVELMFALSLVLLLVFAIFHVAVWANASHRAQSAASAGLAVTRVADGTAAAGRAATQNMLVQLAGGSLRESTVIVDRGVTRARVLVQGTAQPVIPFLTLPVHAEASGPIERLTAEGTP